MRPHPFNRKVVLKRLIRPGHVSVRRPRRCELSIVFSTVDRLPSSGAGQGLLTNPLRYPLRWASSPLLTADMLKDSNRLVDLLSL